MEAAGADLDLRDLAVDYDAGNLKVRLPGAPGLVVCVRYVVAVGDALVADVAAISLNCHDQFTSSMRAISAPSPLR